ncbi:MAG: serine aminopeptidase domain-containing protein [Pontiellaceae bacterium]
MKSFLLAAGSFFAMSLNVFALDMITKTIPEIRHHEISDINPEYLVIYPEKKESEPPLLIYLHGAGQRGEDITELKKWGGPAPVRFYRSSGSLPFLIIAPQCKENRFWNVGDLNALFKHVSEAENFDKDRVYITGVSMGGHGTFRWVANRPEIFAAAVPVCGGWGRKDSAKPSTVEIKNLSSVPFWIFHGDQDKVVPSEGSKNLSKWIDNENGYKTKLKIYENLGHAIWNETYTDNGRIYKWFLSKNRKK